MPVKVSVSVRASVTAGFANEVDAVNQYAAVMYAPTANGTTDDLRREQLQITDSRPNVATHSLNTCDDPLRACSDSAMTGPSTIRFATATPLTAPATCATAYNAAVDQERPPWLASANETTGLKCAPEIGP